jgi:hypothetical protein
MNRDKMEIRKGFFERERYINRRGIKIINFRKKGEVFKERMIESIVYRIEEVFRVNLGKVVNQGLIRWKKIENRGKSQRNKEKRVEAKIEKIIGVIKIEEFL